MNNTGLYCTSCNKEFGPYEDVTEVHGGMVEQFLDNSWHVISDDYPSYQVLCKKCAALQVEPQQASPGLVKAIQMEREIAGHLLVDDPNPWIMTEWKEAMDYTNGLIDKPQPKASAL